MMLDWNIKTPKTKLQVFGLFGLLSSLQAKQSELRFQKKWSIFRQTVLLDRSLWKDKNYTIFIINH